MKKFFKKPGFEFIFSLSLIVILGLPPVLLAQSKKDLEIKIENGDTTVNGKSIKELSPKDRQEALTDISHLGPMDGGADVKKDMNQHVYAFKVRRDSADVRANRMGFRKPGDDRGFNNGPNGMGMGMRMRFERRNTQNFDYISTDNEGISTHVRFHVSEISNDDLKRMPHVEGGKFEITDLNLVPEFTSGKTVLMFNLPEKTAAEVKLHDSEGKLLWSEKASGGNFSKTFTMGLNGVYYLQVKQGRNISIKKIMKEE